MQEQIKIAIIDNYSYKKTDAAIFRIKKTIEKKLNVQAKVKIFKFNKLPSNLLKKYDSLILSGSDYNLSNPKIQQKFYQEIELIKSPNIPILGICFGLHLILFANGCKIQRNQRSTEVNPKSNGWGKKIALNFEKDELIPLHLMTFNLDHKDFVSSSDTTANEHFFIKSTKKDKKLSYIQYAKHKTKPLYCIQFHPESYYSKQKEIIENGFQIFKNFISIISEHKNSFQPSEQNI